MGRWQREALAEGSAPNPSTTASGSGPLPTPFVPQRPLGVEGGGDRIRRSPECRYHRTALAKLDPTHSTVCRDCLIEQAAELRTFRDIALLRRVDVDRPPDAPTDYAGGAQLARELGMRRLAERLEKAGSP